MKSMSMKNIHHIFKTLPFSAFLILFVGCKDKKEEIFTPEVTLSQTSFDFTHEGGSMLLSASTNTELELQGPEADWYSIKSSEGSESKQVFTITALPNSSANSREAKLTLLGRDYARDLWLRQEGTSLSYKPEEALAVAHTLGMGWNLGNQLDAHANKTSKEKISGKHHAPPDCLPQLVSVDASLA